MNDLAAIGKAGALLAADAIKASSLREHLPAPRFKYELVCVGADGVERWREDFSNLVTTAGKNDLLTQYLKGSAYTAAWFVGLIDASGYSAVAAGDTASSHAGWTESTAYSNANRPTLTLGTAASGSIDNSASKAQFNINATATLKGAFTITNNTKGGTTGTLYSAGTFAADRSVINGDTLNVQVTLSV